MQGVMRNLLMGLALVLCMAAGASAVDLLMYGRFDTGMQGSFGPTGYVGADGISRVIFYSPDYESGTAWAHIYKVTIPDGANGDTHPGNPSATGPIAPRTYTKEHSFDLKIDPTPHSEFYVPDAGNTIYLGASLGIHKYVFDQTTGSYLYQGRVAPPAPADEVGPSQSLAYDKDTDTWYAGANSTNYKPGVTERYIWKYDGSNGPDGQWTLAFRYTTPYYFDFHDGMVMLNGHLFLADYLSDMIFEYSTDGVLINSYNRELPQEYGEGDFNGGMGFGALAHFWYGSPRTTITEYGMAGQAPLNHPPVAEAGPPVTISTDQWTGTTIAGSVTDPDRGALLCRWLNGQVILKDWAAVGSDGGCPLPLGALPPFPIGSHPLTIEGMDEQHATAQDQTTVTVTIYRQSPQLKVVTTPKNGTFTQGSQVSFNIEISNPAEPGSSPAENVWLTNLLPSNGGLTWTSVQVTQGACSIINNSLRCGLGVIPPGGSVNVVVSSPASTPAEACQPQHAEAVVTANGGLTAQDSGWQSCTRAACTISGVNISNTSWNRFKIPPETAPVVWVHAHIGTPKGIPALAKTTVTFTGGAISLNGTRYPLPDALLTFDPAAPAITTTFNAALNRWETVVNPNKPSGEIFFTGAALPVTPEVAAGAKATVSFTVLSEAPDLSFPWQWSAAVYTYWPADWNQAMIQPYHGSSHAGAPTNKAVQSSLVAGPRGGGGSNFTGSWSATGNGTCP